MTIRRANPGEEGAPPRAALLLVALVLASACGPKTREASIAVLVAAGGIVVLANALVGLLWLLWRRVRAGLGFRWRPFVVIGLALSGVGLVAEVVPSGGSMGEWLVIALWAVGTSYLTFFLLVWRVRLSAPHGLAWAHAIAGTLMFAPALPLAFVGASQEPLPDALMVLWVLPGYAGFVSGPLFVLLLIEALVRWRSARGPRGASAARR